MALAEDLGRLAREVIASYEARIASVERIIEATHETLEAFRSQREAMRTRLRETLARSASLRKRDFDAMMQGILARQEARERALKNTMRHYLRERRALAASLKGALDGSETNGTTTLQNLLTSTAARWEAQEREIRALLAEFQGEQEEVARTLGGLLSGGRSARVKDFKAALTIIQSRRELGGRDGGGQMRLLPGEGARSL